VASRPSEQLLHALHSVLVVNAQRLLGEFSQETAPRRTSLVNVPV
jgi:hypothetical protein